MRDTVRFNPPVAATLRLPRTFIILALAWPAVAAGADPVRDRFGQDFATSTIKFEYGMEFTALGRPADDADVKAARALFSLEGLGERRVWKLPQVPIYARWKRETAEEKCPVGVVLQAEELLVEGQWRRYFGFLAEEGVAVVPASRLDFWPPRTQNLRIAWWYFTNGFGIGMTTPGVSVRDGEYSATPSSLDEPIEVQLWLQNLHGERRTLPGDLHRDLPANKHSFRKGLSICLRWAAFDRRRALRDYPRDGDFTNVPAKYTQHDSDELAHPGLELETLDATMAWRLDLRELFEITREGHYQLFFQFDEATLAIDEKRSSPMEIQGFNVGKRPRELSIAELNEEVGCLGGKAGLERLRHGIAEDFKNPPAEVPGAPELPADFPAFVRRGFMGASMSGMESKYIQYCLSNSELIGKTREYSRKSVRGEFEKRMSAERSIEALRLIYAGIAAEAGSETAACEILDAMKSTEYATVMNVHSLLADLLRGQGRPPGNWVVDLAMAVVDDDRFVTGLERTNWAAGTSFRISYLADEYGHVVFALGETQCRKAVPLLIDRVRRSSASRGYVMALGSMGDERAIPVLMEYLVRLVNDLDDGHDRRDRVIWALSRLKAKECIPILVNHLEFPASIRALEELGDPTAVPSLKALIQAGGVVTRDGKPLADYHCSERLGRAKIAVAVLEEGDRVPRLSALLVDPTLDEFQRVDVIQRLRQTTDPRAVGPLLDRIRKDSQGRIQYFAISALASFRCPEAVDALIECLGMDFTGKNAGKLASDPAQFREAARAGLRSLTRVDHPADAEQWKAWWRSHRDGFRFPEPNR